MLPSPSVTFRGLLRLSTAALAALALLAGLLASGPAAADAPAPHWGSRGQTLRATPIAATAVANSVYIDPANTTVSAGGLVTVSLMASADTVAIGAWTVDIAFDPAVLDAISCVAHPAGLCNAGFNVMTVRSVGATALGLSGVVELAQITFQGIGAGGDCSALDLTAETLTDPEGNNISLALFGGGVCIEVIPNSIYIDPASATVAPGGDVTVSLMAGDPTPNLGAWTIDVRFDSAVLDAIDCTPTAPAATVCNAEFDSVTVRDTGASATGLTGVIQLATITFNAPRPLPPPRPPPRGGPLRVRLPNPKHQKCPGEGRPQPFLPPRRLRRTGR